MNVVTNKAIVIAVGIFITIAITSAILFALNQMREVYSGVYETDISISSGFKEFDQFDGTKKTGLDLFNAINKYYKKSNVEINVGSSAINVNNTKTEEQIINSYDRDYTKEYKCSISKRGDITIITFTP